MITETESGLTTEQYAAIQAATGDLAIEVLLQRYGPVWTSHDTSPSQSGANFDAAIASTYLLRVYVGDTSTVAVERLPSESGGDQNWAAGACPISDVDVEVAPTLVTDGLTARLFYYTTDGKICYVECADISTTFVFDAPVEVGEVAGVIQLAAVSTTKVYYITQDSNTLNRRLRFYHFNGSWSATSSDIYWPFPIYGFDAVAMTGLDLLMMTSELPPLVGSRAVGSEITTKVERVQGVVAFRVQNGRWSDHHLVDVIDRVETHPARTDLRLSYVNSTLFATYTRCGGGGSYTYSKLAICRSKDAIGWEFPELVETALAPCLVLPRADYLYAVGVNRTLRSPCCAWAGQTPVQQDVTTSILSVESMAAEIRDTSLGIANVSDVLAGTLAKSNARIQAIYYLGYVVGGDLSDILKVQVSTEDVLIRGEERMLPRHGLTLTTQDRLGRLNRTVSDFAAEWPGQQAGRDPYDDPSGTGYGGLRFTAPYEGSWKASSGMCNLISANREGLAVSTLVSSAFNGSAQTAFKLYTESEGEYAGLAFRVFDKDNLFFVIYDLDADKIYLKKRVAGTDTTLATSAAMSWGVLTWYYLKVRTHYSMVYVYYSTDGITWTALSWDSGSGEIAGVPEGQVETAYDGFSGIAGKFGLIGYGYSEDDEYDGWDPQPWEPIITDDIPDTPSVAVVWSMDQLARTTAFDTSYPVWEDFTPGDVDYIYRVWRDRGSGFAAWMLGGYDKEDANEGLWHIDDVRTGSWTLVASQLNFRNATIAAGGSGDHSVRHGISHSPGLFCAVENKGFSGDDGSAIHVCNTSGIVNTWWSDDLDWYYYGSDGEGTYEAFRCRSSFVEHTDQVAYWNGAIYVTGRGRWNPDAVVWTYEHGAYAKSTDGGYNWVIHTKTGGRYSDGQGPRSLGIAGGTLYTFLLESDQYSIYDLIAWNEVIPPGDIHANYATGACSHYHPSALFVPARGSVDADDHGYIWRDGGELIRGEDVWQEQGDLGRSMIPRSFVAYPKGSTRGCFVYDENATDPPLVYWLGGGAPYDKTGNLLTVLGGSWSGSYDGGTGKHYLFDNAAILFFWE